MPVLTFNPGPSKLSELTKEDIHSALALGIAEMSHRSAAFSEMSEGTIRELRAFLGIPAEYQVFYTPSATEAMELTIRNLVERKSCHFTCGSFSELFAKLSENLGKSVTRIAAPWGESPVYDATGILKDEEFISITMNETSTGVMCHPEDIERIRTLRPDAMLVVDITSIVGMKTLPIVQADVWLCSVQKGFGLPSGMGILIVSPRALKRAEELLQTNRNLPGVFNFAEMERYMRRGAQTVCTPNVLDIFLLGRQLSRWNEDGGCMENERQTRRKATLVYDAIAGHPQLKPFVTDPRARSISVACISAPPGEIIRLHERAKEKNILLGKGYGKLKESTFRLALFPAISEEDIRRVIGLL